MSNAAAAQPVFMQANFEHADRPPLVCSQMDHQRPTIHSRLSYYRRVNSHAIEREAMSQFELLSVLLAGISVLINSVLFIVFWFQLKTLHRQVDGEQRSVQLDHQQRRVSETLRYYTDAFILSDLGRDYAGGELKLLNQILVGEPMSIDLSERRDRLRLFEVFATGINVGAFDETTADRASGSSVLTAWAIYRDAIREQREKVNNHRLYEEFEFLAKRLIELNPTYWAYVDAATRRGSGSAYHKRG